MQALIEILKANPWILALFGGMALVIAVLVFVLLRKDIKHLKELFITELKSIEKQLNNHVTETDQKIDRIESKIDKLSDRFDRLCELLLKDKDRK